jgi:pyruvate-formate lyase-activating enzyme
MESSVAGYLPLFSYGAVGWHQGEFRSAAIRIDKEPRQDLRYMPHDKVLEGIQRMRRLMPHNRLRAHLETCALTYGCPAGKNFFLQRYEAPLPTSPACNARCLGCISQQPDNLMPNSQDRIPFKPRSEEIAEVAMAHIRAVKRAVVSFGQGCEGDPLLAADVIVPAIRQIRKKTECGTINMNTNGGLPSIMEALLEAGLDSIRISMNSVRKVCYDAYFRPQNYRFDDVLTTIHQALSRGAHVAINYLNCPGFTDTPEERDALLDFLTVHPIHMIQWRNLNFDPGRYITRMNETVSHGRPLGMPTLLKQVRRVYPNLRHGYFNPPREAFMPLPNAEAHRLNTGSRDKG